MAEPREGLYYVERQLSRRKKGGTTITRWQWEEGWRTEEEAQKAVAFYRRTFHKPAHYYGPLTTPPWQGFNG